MTKNELRLLDSIQKHGPTLTIGDHARLWKRSYADVNYAAGGLLGDGLIDMDKNYYLRFSKAAERRLKAAGVTWKV